MCARCVHALGRVVAGRFWCSYAWVSLTQTAPVRPRACVPVRARVCVRGCACVLACVCASSTRVLAVWRCGGAAGCVGAVCWVVAWCVGVVWWRHTSFPPLSLGGCWRWRCALAVPLFCFSLAVVCGGVPLAGGWFLGRVQPLASFVCSSCLFRYVYRYVFVPFTLFPPLSRLSHASLIY